MISSFMLSVVCLEFNYVISMFFCPHCI